MSKATQAADLADRMNQIFQNVHPCVLLLAIRLFEAAIVASMREMAPDLLRESEREWTELQDSLRAAMAANGCHGGN